MAIRIVNNRRYLFEKQQPTCDFMKTVNYSVTEINQHNKKISVTRVLPFKISLIISMIKEDKLCLERLTDKKVDSTTWQIVWTHVVYK